MRVPAGLAQGIVERLKTVLSSQVNFIDTDGRIIASTDPERVGARHGAGAHVAATAETVVVEYDGQWGASRRGVNAPIWIGDEVIGSVGVTGDPERVGQYGGIIGEMTSIMLREELALTSTASRRERHRLIIESLFEGALPAVAEEADDEVGALVRGGCLVVHGEVAGIDGELLDPARTELLDPGQTESLYRATHEIFPADRGHLFGVRRSGVTLLLPASAQPLGPPLRQLHDRLAHRLGRFVAFGIGDVADAQRALPVSRARAGAAASVARRERLPVVAYADLDLELISLGTSAATQAAFVDRVLGPLDADERRIFAAVLDAYERHNAGLQATADELLIHRNTVQNRLNLLARRTGYNPRNLRDFVRLRLAFQLDRRRDRLDDAGIVDRAGS